MRSGGSVQVRNYESAKEAYSALGLDTESAIEKVKSAPVSLHCWQGDDIHGFDNAGPLSGGILTTGNYPGIARTPEELMSDIDKVFSLCPGTKKLNLHANYAIVHADEKVDRDNLEPKHFDPWVDFANERGIGLDFNPTFFSHPMAGSGLTLGSPDENIRSFWVRHGKACVRISQYFAEKTGKPVVMNMWAGDGLKDVPADRIGPRMRYLKSFEEIISEPHDPELVKPSVESKTFGIGVESYTVGSAEFTMLFAATHPGVLPLMDNGHYHPQEYVSDKIAAVLCHFPEIALHVTRGVRWDSDHVVLYDDETREIAKEVVRCGLDRVHMALDYFDASINRIAAWSVGFRSWQKALLNAHLIPNEELTKLQNEGDFTRLMIRQEELKVLPFGAVWDEYCARCGAPSDAALYDLVKAYEEDVLSKRI